MGAVCSIPAWYLGGVLFSSWVGKRIHIPVPEEMLAAARTGGGRGGGSADDVVDERADEPNLGQVVAIIAIPLLLILAGTFGSIVLPAGSTAAGIANFIGTPAVALTIAVLLAFWLLGYRRGMTRSRVAELSAASLRPVGMILLVVGAGAFYGAVLKATGIGDVIADTLHDRGLPVIFAAYVSSCGLRIAQGSATAAIAATAAIVGPTIKEVGYSQPQRGPSWKRSFL